MSYIYVLGIEEEVLLFKSAAKMRNVLLQWHRGGLVWGN